jgi:SAM-dependent methyltransferase
VGDHESGYLDIVSHYEACLAAHGDSHRGVDWPNASDAAKRYDVMLDMLTHPRRAPGVSLLDFGCGAGHLLEHLNRFGPADVQYLGADISPRFVELCREKFPGRSFTLVDALCEPDRLPEADFIVANGVFTEKRALSWEAMWDYTQRMITSLFRNARIGLAFNVMSHHVDWEREDLFHLSFDTLAAFLKAQVSRHFIFRADYGLYEYTAYVYREAR